MNQINKNIYNSNTWLYHLKRKRLSCNRIVTLLQHMRSDPLSIKYHKRIPLWDSTRISNQSQENWIRQFRWNLSLVIQPHIKIRRFHIFRCFLYYIHSLSIVMHPMYSSIFFVFYDIANTTKSGMAEFCYSIMSSLYEW